MNLLALIQWLGGLSEFIRLQRTYAVHNFKASIVVQRETTPLLHPPSLAFREFTRRLGMSRSNFGFALETIYSA